MDQDFWLLDCSFQYSWGYGIWDKRDHMDHWTSLEAHKTDQCVYVCVFPPPHCYHEQVMDQPPWSMASAHQWPPASSPQTGTHQYSASLSLTSSPPPPAANSQWSSWQQSTTRSRLFSQKMCLHQTTNN